MDKRVFKDKAYSIISKLVKALGNPHRLEIIDLLSQAERSVEEIAFETNISIANASQHLQLLKQSRLVDVRRDGNFIYYRLSGDDVYAAGKTLRALGMHNLAEMEKVMKDYRTQRKNLEPVRLNELLVKMRTRHIILLDVRSEYEFNAGHIPGAVNIPIGRLASQLNELKKNIQYVAYCRGPFCVFADDAVELLLEKGFKALRLEEGYPDWKSSNALGI